MHEMLQLLPKDPDSESGSYTDSGHGHSEEGEILQQAEKKILGSNSSKAMSSALFYSYTRPPPS